MKEHAEEFSHKTLRYIKGLAIGFPLLFMSATGAHFVFYNYVDIDYFGKYFSIKPSLPVFPDEYISFTSDSHFHVNRAATWYDTLWCDGENRRIKLNTQEWPDVISKGARKVGYPWLYSASTIPEWATSCQLKGQLCVALPFDVIRCIKYQSEPFPISERK